MQLWGIENNPQWRKAMDGWRLKLQLTRSQCVKGCFKYSTKANMHLVWESYGEAGRLLTPFYSNDRKFTFVSVNRTSEDYRGKKQKCKPKKKLHVAIQAHNPLCTLCQESVEAAESESTVFFVFFFLAEQGLWSLGWRSFALPRHASCTHSNTAELKPDWRGQPGPLLPAVCPGFDICDGILAGTSVHWALIGSRS